MGLGSGLLGAVIGGLCGGPLGALIGGGIGAMLFNGQKESGPAASSSSASSRASEPSAFPLENVFECLGKLAKSDGHVSREEAAFAAQLMKTLQLPSDVRQVMKEAFNRGRDSAEPFTATVSRLAKKLNVASAASRELRKTVFNTLCAIAMVDRDLAVREKEMLRQAEQALRLPGELNEFLRRNERTEEPPPRTETPKSDGLQACYELLGIRSDASDAEVKKAWREKAKAFHPDRVQGAGLSADFIDFAKQKMQQINKAYETICKSRGI